MHAACRLAKRLRAGSIDWPTIIKRFQLLCSVRFPTVSVRGIDFCLFLLKRVSDDDDDVYDKSYGVGLLLVV